MKNGRSCPTIHGSFFCLFTGFFILGWGHTCVFFKYGREVMGVREHKHFRYLEEIEFRCSDQLFCLVYLHFGEIINYGISARLNEAFGNVGFAKGKLVA